MSEEPPEIRSLRQVVSINVAMVCDIPDALRIAAFEGWRSVAITLAMIPFGLFVVLPIWSAWHALRLTLLAIRGSAGGTVKNL